jgi:hypothetical protein
MPGRERQLPKVEENGCGDIWGMGHMVDTWVT